MFEYKGSDIEHDIYASYIPLLIRIVHYNTVLLLMKMELLIAYTDRKQAALYHISKGQITSAWYYHADVILSRLHDTMYQICVKLHYSHVFDTEKKYMAEGLSLNPCNTGCIRFKFPFQINFEAKKILIFFSNLE